MRRVSGLVVVLGALLGLGGCGGGGDDPQPHIVTRILSDPGFDGDIELAADGSYVITQGMSPTVQSVFAGFDPTAGTEFRAFLDFALTGSNGVPGDALIDSAFLEIFVDDLVPPSGSLPLLVELVSFQPPNLIGTDFDRSAQPPLAAVSVSGDVTNADVGHFIPIDVTRLMIRAQQLGLVDFQVRIMEDLGPAIYTMMVIDDTTGANRSAQAPLLTVTYHYSSTANWVTNHRTFTSMSQVKTTLPLLNTHSILAVKGLQGKRK